MQPNEYQRRILQLSQQWNLTLPPPAVPLGRPDRVPSFQSPSDDQAAEDLLQRRAAELAQLKPKSGLSRAFSSNSLKKGKHWDPKEVVEVLASYITNGGSAGVVEALLGKLAASGVELGNGQKLQKSGILNRRRSSEAFVDRARLLRLAVDGNQVNTLQVLLPHADGLALDACLPAAMRMANMPIVELLLRYGANAGQTVEGQDAFRQACAVQGRAPMLNMIMHSEGRISPVLVSQAMNDATRAGCLDNVLALSRSTADGNYNHAEALQSAVNMGRRDIALAIVMGNNPPQRPGLDEAFRILITSTSLSPGTKLDIAELLLCAGAQGEIPAAALERSVESQFYDMAYLLSSYGVSIEFNNASAVKMAITAGQLDLVSALLNDHANLNPALASACVPLIPKQAQFEERGTLLTLLLKKGANGVVLDQCLVEAAESGDISSVDLLVHPNFPNTMPNVNGTTRHSVASSNYKSGEALRTAVLKADTLLVEKILAARPSADTLTTVFPLTRNLSPADRPQMTSLFLRGPLSGACLHAALQDELSAPPSQRDEALIKALLDRDADVNFKDGEGLVPLIKQMDLKLLSAIIPRVSPQTAAMRVPDGMAISDHRTRFEVLSMLLRAGAAIGMQQISEALLQNLSEKPVDMSLLRLLLEQGNADINGIDGALTRKAVENPDPKVLEMLFTFGKPSDTTIMQTLNDIAAQFSNESKTWKLNIVLAKSTRQDDVKRILVSEVQSLIQNKEQKPSLSPLKQLLASGADPNAYQASALCHAVIGADTPIIDELFACKNPPTVASIGTALPHAVRIADPGTRLAITDRLAKSGATPFELNRALTYVLQKSPNDIRLVQVLASGADMSDGDALSLSITSESPELVQTILSNSKQPTEVRHRGLGQAMEIKNRGARKSICELLLASGVSAQIASAALLVAARDGDLSLGETLMQHGASISSNNGKAIIEASRGGSVEVLNVLLKSDTETSPKTLEEAFQGATEVRDLNKRAVIFELLLSRGVAGELVDAQLQSAARYGNNGEGILKVLLAAGADPNHNNGEALVAATRSAFTGSIALLLGLWDEGGSQKKPSQPTLVRCLKGSWALSRDTRFEVIENLFKAGLDVSEDLHIALNDAVNEQEPEDRLVKLLLRHGASPMANECKTLIDASRNVASSCLGLLLDRKIEAKDINRAFDGAFTSDTFQDWFTDRGLLTAQMLLDKGASGDAISTALVCVMQNGDDNGQLANNFVDLLASHSPDVNFNNGEPLQVAASKANAAWTNRLLKCRPTSETLSLGFQRIFDTQLPQDEVLDLFRAFADYREDGVGIDVMATLQGSDPVLVRAIKQYPRSPLIVETLLDAGYYHDQPVNCILHEGYATEEVTLMSWAIAQPQKRVSSAVIEQLINRGAKVNVVSSGSVTTPLMLAIQQRRPDVVNMLLIEGAEVDAVDHQGRTPLSMATEMGGDASIQMMSSILAAEPCRDDGSLHNCARSLNLPAIKVLVQAGHDPDFPSPLHGGRSALGELCKHGSDTIELMPDRERMMQKAMAFLIDSGSDLSIKADGKSLVYLCFDAAEPVITTRTLLKAGLWKHINQPYNNYSDETFTYSPTMYISKVMNPTTHTPELLSVLRASRAKDVYYANSGPQPDSVVGVPEDMAVIDRARKARDERLAEESQEHAIALNRKREIANIEHQILLQRAEMEDNRRRKQHNEDLAAVRSRAQLEESISASALQRKLADQTAVTEAAMSRTRAIAATELENEEMRQRKALEWEYRINKERVESTRAISAVRISEREEVERVDKAAEVRTAKRLEMQKKLVDSQEKLAKQLSNGPTGNNDRNDIRRQIGYVTEVD